MTGLAHGHERCRSFAATELAKGADILVHEVLNMGAIDATVRPAGDLARGRAKTYDGEIVVGEDLMEIR